MCTTNDPNQPVNPIPNFYDLPRGERRWITLMRKFELSKTVKTKQRIKRNAPTNFNGMIQFVEYFNSEQMCIAYLENIRWKDGVYCPHCGGFEVWQLEDKINYRCKTCSKNFNVKTKTIFEAGKTSLRQWFMTIYLENSFIGGVTTGELERQLPFSRKTTGIMVNKLRECGYNQNCFTTETETANGQKIYILDTMVRDGENRNRHDWRKNCLKTGGGDKKIILVVIQKNGNARAYVIDGLREGQVLPDIYKHIPTGATIYSDEHPSFNPLGRTYEENLEWNRTHPPTKEQIEAAKNDPTHEQYNALQKQFYHYTINHSEKIYGIGDVSTNAVEGWNSFFQTGLGKFRNSISHTYTDLFVNAAIFRYNTRSMNETEKLDLVLTNIFTYHTGTMVERVKFSREAQVVRDNRRTKNYQKIKLEKATEKAAIEAKEKKKADKNEKKAGVEQRRKDREQRKANEAQKKLDKTTTREKKIADKEKVRQEKKAVKAQKKADKETAKQAAKQVRQAAKEQKNQFNEAVKQAAKEIKQAGTSKAGSPKKTNKIFTAGKAGRAKQTNKARLNKPTRTTRTTKTTRTK